MEWTGWLASAGSGYTGLFVVAFLAATLLPVGSEWLLATLLLAGRDPLITVAVATAGNVFGSLTTWLIGRGSGPFLVQRLLRIDGTAQQRAERYYARYGRWSLLLSWLPVIGDPLCLVAGMLRVSLPSFLPLVTLGKLGRYAALAWITLQL